MEQDFWKNKLKYFVVKHPFFGGEDSEEDIYTPREDLKIRFWFEGNLQIEGGFEELEINYNSPDLLVIAKRNEEVENVFRIPWSRLISFEIVIGNEASQKLRDLVKLN